MEAESTLPAYGEWPARSARMGHVELVWAVLAVKGVGGDHAVLMGDCPPGEYRGSDDCSAEAGGYHWSFRGSVFDVTPRGADQVRIWIRSHGELIAREIEVERK